MKKNTRYAYYFIYKFQKKYTKDLTYKDKVYRSSLYDNLEELTFDMIQLRKIAKDFHLFRMEIIEPEIELEINSDLLK